MESQHGSARGAGLCGTRCSSIVLELSWLLGRLCPVGAQQTSVTAVTTSVLIPGSPYGTMVHAPVHPLHALRGWGLHLILKCKSQTFSTGCYDFPPSLVPVLHFLHFLFSFLPSPAPCNTPILKFWCIRSVLWNENVVLNFSDIVKRGWAWQVEIALVYGKSHFLECLFFLWY